MATTPIWNIFTEELRRSRGEAAERIYRRIVALPKEQRSDSVREMVRAITELAQVDTVVVRTGEKGNG